MKRLTALFIISILGIVPGALADTYATDATMSQQTDDGTITVTARVSRLLERNGKIEERVISEPRITSSPGVPATLYTGLQPAHPDYEKEENITVDVFWPFPKESGTASCAVTIKRGDKIVSKSRLQLRIEGPGRVPLILHPEDIDFKSVRVGDEGSKTFVLLEFIGKTKEEVKKLAIDNYGNQVQFHDAEGHTREVGRAFGKYNQLGIALDCESEAEARRVANLLQAGISK